MPKPISAAGNSRHSTEFLVLRRRFEFDEFCERCGAQSRFVSLEDAMRLAALSTREIVRAADAGKIHFLESRAGLLVVCQTSLTARAQAVRLLETSEEKNYKEKTL